MAEAVSGKIYWQCRRGMWELDLYLIPFCQQQYTKLSDTEQACFIQLLSCPDPDIHAWLNGHMSPAPELAAIIQSIRDYAKTSDKSQVI